MGQGMTTWGIVGGVSAVGVAAGLILGATGLRPGPDGEEGQQAGVLSGVHQAYRCNGGDAPGEAVDLRPGDRVYLVGRDESGEWVVLRDPRALDRLVSLPAEAVAPDRAVDLPVVDTSRCDDAVTMTASAGSDTTTSAATDTVPSDSAPVDGTTTSTPVATTPVATTPVATPPATTSPATSPPATSPPGTSPPVVTTTTSPPVVTTTTAPDQTKPVIGPVTRSQSEIWATGTACVDRSNLSVSASDNVGVVSVTGTYAGLPNSPLTFVFQSGLWRATFGPFSGLGANHNQLVTIIVRARDAAGNESSVQTTVKVWGTTWCLI